MNYALVGNTCTQQTHCLFALSIIIFALPLSENPTALVMYETVKCSWDRPHVNCTNVAVKQAQSYDNCT